MRTMSPEELDQLVSELASLARTGVPLPLGLAELTATLPPGTFRDSVSILAAEVERGKPLSRALDTMPGKVPPEIAALVACGEATGDLRNLLEFALEHSRRVRRFRSALLTTMVYPTLLVCVMIATFYFVLTYIMPKIHDIFNQLGAELPGITQGMIVLSALAANPIGTGLAILAVLVLIASLVHRPFHDALYRLMGNMPGYRNLIALSDTAISMKFLERTLSRGVPLPTALSVGALAMQLAESRAALTRMSAAAEQGHEVGPLLSLSTPAVAAWLFRQAEARGDLPATCDGIASYCEDRFDRLSRRTVATLEPVLILLVGVGIALMLLSVYMPLFNIPKIIGVDS